MSYLDLRGVSTWTLIKRSFSEFDDNDMSTYAAALAFRALLSLFPFLLFLTATLSFFNVPEFFNWLRDQAAIAFPPMVMEMIDPVLDQLQDENSTILSISIIMAIFNGYALIDECDEQRLQRAGVPPGLEALSAVHWLYAGHGAVTDARRRIHGDRPCRRRVAGQSTGHEGSVDIALGLAALALCSGDPDVCGGHDLLPHTGR